MLKKSASYEDRYLVCLVCLVEQDQLDELNKPDEPDQPVPPVSRVSHGYPAWCAPIIPDVQTNEIPACPQRFSAAC